MIGLAILECTLYLIKQIHWREMVIRTQVIYKITIMRVKTTFIGYYRDN